VIENFDRTAKGFFGTRRRDDEPVQHWESCGPGSGQSGALCTTDGYLSSSWIV
jgi:hypothetical protein